jgi:hypothetical protein
MGTKNDNNKHACALYLWLSKMVVKPDDEYRAQGMIQGPTPVAAAVDADVHTYRAVKRAIKQA